MSKPEPIATYAQISQSSDRVRKYLPARHILSIIILSISSLNIIFHAASPSILGGYNLLLCTCLTVVSSEASFSTIPDGILALLLAEALPPYSSIPVTKHLSAEESFSIMTVSLTNDAYAADGSAQFTDAAIEAVQHQLPVTGTEKVQDSTEPALHPPANRTVRLVKGDNGQFGFVQGTRLVNNISLVVGFMELANAGDFAANVWNDVPVPIYAIVFMAIGGTAAAVLCILAFRDSKLAYKNVRFLLQQRREQKVERARRLDRAESVRDINVYLAITFRELGNEVIARWFMDLLMGFSAILISVGTYMAIGGANQHVWFASNILSGYLGNAPVALYGLVNSCWASYMFYKAQAHVIATHKVLKSSQAATLVKRRGRNIQVFCMINGTATVLGGVGSMITASQWWGYIILAPVIMSSIFCNIWWRRRVGYTRSQPRSREFPSLAPSDLITELEFAAQAEIIIREHQTSPISQLVADPGSLPDVLAFIQRHALLDDFCLTVVSTQDLRDALGGGQSPELNIGLDELLAVPKPFHAKLLEKAHELVQELGREHFRHRERYTAELLGTYYVITGGADFNGNEDKRRGHLHENIV